MRTALGNDIADGGNDKNVIAKVILKDGLYTWEIYREFTNRTNIQMGGEIITAIKDLRLKETDVCAIENVGVGAGAFRVVEDWLDKQSDEKDGYNPEFFGINWAGNPQDEDTYSTQKSEIWGLMGILLQKGIVTIVPHEGLKQDLTSLMWKGRDSQGRRQLESKEVTKKRLGRSPDYGDAIAIALMGILGNSNQPKATVIGGEVLEEDDF